MTTATDEIPKRGRKPTKAPSIPFKFKKPLEKYLRTQADKEGKTLVRFVEDLLEYRRKFKTFPPSKR